MNPKIESKSAHTPTPWEVKGDLTDGFQVVGNSIRIALMPSSGMGSQLRKKKTSLLSASPPTTSRRCEKH